jgi:hypothetical protein
MSFNQKPEIANQEQFKEEMSLVEFIRHSLLYGVEDIDFERDLEKNAEKRFYADK